eukprot:gene22617-23829_t
MCEARDAGIPASAECDALFELLSAVNLKLWNVEDALRDHEREGRFDAGFIVLARSVYVLNDERAALKKAINLLLDRRERDGEIDGFKMQQTVELFEQLGFPREAVACPDLDERPVSIDQYEMLQAGELA